MMQNDITPTCPQFDYITASDQFPAMVAGFGSGKTEAAIKRAIIGKLKYPKLNRGFYEPTYDLVRMIAFPRFEEALTELDIPYKLFKSPLNYIEIEHAGKIFFRSMDTPSRIIGYEHADADVDELDTLKLDDAADVWRRIQSRNRQKKPDSSLNTIGVTTTPEGFKFVYNTWKKDPKQGYRIIQAPTNSNPHLPDGYIQSMRDSYPSQLIEAYLMGEFVNLTSGTIYNSFDRALNNTDRVWDGKEPVYIGMDFNVGKMSAVVHVKDSDGPRAVDEIINAYDTPDIINVIKSRYNNCTIRVYPDASGGSRKSVDASRTDIVLLEQAGFSVIYNKKNPFVKDRILAMNRALCDNNGKREYLINISKCPSYADCLEQQVWGSNGEPDKTQGKDHANDAGGYFIAMDYPIIRPVAQMPIRFAR
jgi:hypothetical protein